MRCEFRTCRNRFAAFSRRRLSSERVAEACVHPDRHQRESNPSSERPSKAAVCDERVPDRGEHGVPHEGGPPAEKCREAPFGTYPESFGSTLVRKKSHAEVEVPSVGPCIRREKGAERTLWAEIQRYL